MNGADDDEQKMRLTHLLVSAGALLALGCCNREERASRVAQSKLDHDISLLEPLQQSAASKKYGYEESYYAISQGKLLYEQYNCVGCHAHGGGGIGPALISERSIYGWGASQIHESIVAGRPNGMPSFRGKIPDYQIWQLVAYVRSMTPADSSRQRGPGSKLETSRAAEDARLNSDGSIDEPAGIVRIPIERAMDLITHRGLPTRGPGTQNASDKTPEQMRWEKAVPPPAKR